MSETQPAPEPADESLMRAACRGDRAAFAALVARHQRSLYALFRRLGADAHAAEDCVQDTFLRLLRAHARWSPRAPFRAFLLVLARNAFVDHCRRRRARPAQLPADDDAPGADAALAVPGVRLPFDHAPQDVRDALASLSSGQRAVVELGIWRGLPYREIALLLEIPEGTVKSRMHTAVARLREVLQRDAIA
jgi:RNA polymerase sigma-70 factor, ECF subfamily